MSIIASHGLLVSTFVLHAPAQRGPRAKLRKSCLQLRRACRLRRIWRLPATPITSWPSRGIGSPPRARRA